VHCSVRGAIVPWPVTVFFLVDAVRVRGGGAVLRGLDPALDPGRSLHYESRIAPNGAKSAVPFV
jgi:hypothetical protein